MSRAVRVLGNEQEMMRLAGEMTGIINSTSSLDVTFWRQLFGATPGVVAWTAMIENRIELLEESAKFEGIPEYVDLRTAFRANATPPVDAIREIINYEEDWPGPPAVAGLNVGQMVGKPRTADWALDVAAYVKGMYGRPVGVSINTVGPMGQWGMHFGADSVEQFESEAKAMWADPGHMKLMAAGEGLFVPGRGGQWVFGRVD